MPLNAEQIRLEEDFKRSANWKRWGPYLSERQWATVREDYSADGDSWGYFPHEHAAGRSYRWGEDGLLGICDRECRLCFALALWNGKDPILKERLFGLTSPQGNHGEDVKEYYYYLDSTPTHSYMRALYKYPQDEFPYRRLIEENRKRTKFEPEFELHHTGVFDNSRYFDITAEYAKADPNDILIRLTVRNAGPHPAPLDLLAVLWFRNSWRWGAAHEASERPKVALRDNSFIEATHPTLGTFNFLAGSAADISPQFLFTENETNKNLFGAPNESPYVKDSFEDVVIRGAAHASNPLGEGTKAAARYRLHLEGGESISIPLRLSEATPPRQSLGGPFDLIFASRKSEAAEFYDEVMPRELNTEERQVVRKSYAGLLWSKQFYHYIVPDWLEGDANEPRPPCERKAGRNADWRHIYNYDVVSTPDKWEYPWYAAWDLAFHMIPFARFDPNFAKQQIVLFLREWYTHPNGQIPAYEFNLADVNPPVHAWACWRIYKMTGARGNRDRLFLSRCFQKLILNFTWWVNRKDLEGRNLFAGGFLGLDNIGLFDRSRPFASGMTLEQADATAWMAFYCSTMLSIALELSRDNPATEDMASKFFEHFIAIADAINTQGASGLWDEEDGFYYDQLRVGAHVSPLKVRSLVGLIPLIAVEVLDEDLISRLKGFRKRMDWFLNHRPDLAATISYCELGGARRLLAIPSRERLLRLLRYLLDENEFLSPYGIRSLSKIHGEHPYTWGYDGQEYRIAYEPGESTTSLFGGNSNWRGPIWLPLNFLIVEALERYHYYYGDHFQVEFPTGSATLLNLKQVADAIGERLTRLFVSHDRRPAAWLGEDQPPWSETEKQELLLFHEYFHAETGQGLGASHQTGWTALISNFVIDRALRRGDAR